jgi:hypothetical protein
VYQGLSGGGDAGRIERGPQLSSGAGTVGSQLLHDHLHAAAHSGFRRHPELREDRPTVLWDVDVDDPGCLPEVRRQLPNSSREMPGVDVGRAGLLVAEGLDEHILFGILGDGFPGEQTSSSMDDDGGCRARAPTNHQRSDVDSKDEADRLFEALSDGGSEASPMAEMP